MYPDYSHHTDGQDCQQELDRREDHTAALLSVLTPKVTVSRYVYIGFLAAWQL